MKPCPHCAEEIQDQAKICRHCGRSAHKSRAGALSLALIGLFIFAIVMVPRRPDSAVTATSAAGAVPVWRIERGRSQMDGSPSVEISGEARDAVPIGGAQRRPNLRIRCQERKTQVILYTGYPFQSDANRSRVRVRLDDDPALNESWYESTSMTALFAPRGETLAHDLALTKNFLRLEFIPFREGAVVAQFDVRGLAPHLAEVARACGWKMPAQ